METKNLIEKLDQTTADFLAALTAFSPGQMNFIPFEGSWTGGQVTEHVLKSETGLPGTLLGQTVAADRPADQHVPVIEGIFLDFTTKLNSPEFILPSAGPHNKDDLIRAFRDEREAVRKIASTEDLTLVCTGFEFPQIGPLTRWEWINFIICHSTRHTRQLRNILEKVEG